MFCSQPLFETDSWDEAEVGVGERRVGVGMPHVALLRRIDAYHRLAPSHTADEVENLVDRDPRPTSDIVHTARNAFARGGDVCRHDIAHEREIACLLAVAVDGDRLAEDRRAQELVKSHVGPLPWSVDGEVAQRYGRHAKVGVVQVTELLSSELRHAV